jgi:hypothetical protein
MKHRTPSRLLAILLAGLLAACAPTQQDGTPTKSQPRSDQSALGRVAESETRPTAQATRSRSDSPADAGQGGATTGRDDGHKRLAQPGEQDKRGEARNTGQGGRRSDDPSPC